MTHNLKPESGPRGERSVFQSEQTVKTKDEKDAAVFWEGSAVGGARCCRLCWF